MFGVEEDGSGDDDGVEVRGEELVKIGVEARVATDSFARGLHGCGIDVAEGGDARGGVFGEKTCEIGTAVAVADDADADRGVGG
jgi:hypothetical protein